MTSPTPPYSRELSAPKPGPRILLVGAGAVGLTYGYHLSRGGANVTFFVKEKYRTEAEAGYLMHQHRPLRRPRAFYFDDYAVISDLDAVANHTWDQVWLCVASPALRGDWLAEFCARIGQATLVSLQPGLEDLERVAQVYDPAKIIAGSILFIAYQTPLPGENLREGVAFLIPPAAPSPFSPLLINPNLFEPSDSDLRCERVVEALNRGDLVATVDPQTP